MERNIPVSYNIPFLNLAEPMHRSFFRELALNGARHVVLGTGMLTQMIAQPELPEVIAAELEEAGLSFADSHAPYGLHWDLSAPFEAERGARTLRMLLAIELASFFKVGTMTLHLGKKSPEMTPEQRVDAVCRSLEKLVPFAEEKKVTLCLENGFAYLGFPQQLLTIRERFPSLGICFDAGHANMSVAPDPAAAGKVPEMKEILEALLPHIANCHIHDNDGSCDRHDLPGRGNADWEYICGKLKEAPRLQVIQSEVNIPKNGVAIRELVETFRRMFE